MSVRVGDLDGDKPLTDEQVAELAQAVEQAAIEDGKLAPPGVSREDARLPGWGGWLRTATNLARELVRYRVFYGGRGGAKSRTIASELLLRGTEKPERILCTREFQKSIRDSVKRLLDDEINRLGLGVLGSGFYVSTDKEIRGANGTLFVFHGLHRNENGIRSLEGITIAWVEEARFVSQDSLDALIPTIRAPGSEIWFSYNPKDPKDPVDVMFRGKHGPPPGSVVVEVNYYDNPWFGETALPRDMEYDKRRDFDRYRHIWLGQYLERSESKVFKNWKVRPFEVPEDAVIRSGADWGFASDPNVLVSCFIGRWSGEAWESEPVADPDGNVLFVRYEAYEVGTIIEEIPALFAGDDDVHPTKRRWENPRNLPGVPEARRWKIIADSARPEIIDYMSRRGFNIEPAVKGPGSLEEGVTFLQGYDICVHPSCIHVADELALYSYKVDPKTEEVLPVLADKDNHTIDALRYALENVRRAGSGKVNFASSGKRDMVRAVDGKPGGGELRKQAEVATPPRQASVGGRGWGSSGGSWTGVMD